MSGRYSTVGCCVPLTHFSLTLLNLFRETCPNLMSSHDLPRPKSRSASDSVQNPVETYLRDIHGTELLTARQEKELALRIAQGDAQARDQMVRANLRLVVNIARRYLGRGLPLQDLIADGNLGLLRAVEGFDPSLNTRFSTYASLWIKQSIKRGLINTGKTIRIPAYMVELMNKSRQSGLRLKEQLGRPATLEEIAADLGISAKKLEILKQALEMQNATMQSEPIDSNWTLGEVVADDRTRSPDENLEETDSLGWVRRELHRLDERAALILKLHYGLDDGEPQTLRAIGEMLGLTRERVRQIELEALQKLASGLNGGDQ